MNTVMFSGSDILMIYLDVIICTFLQLQLLYFTETFEL